LMESLGSGNWRCLYYQRASGAALVGVQDGEVTFAKLASTVISGATAETSPAVDDLLLLSDTSASTVDKITLENMLKVVNGLTEDTSPDKSSDFLLSYDASSSAPKKVTPENAVKAALSAAGSAPAFACRAWVNFNGTGTVAIRASGNVSSVTDTAIGAYTVNFTIALPDTDYAVAGMNANSNGNCSVGENMNISRTTSSVSIGSYSTANSIFDSTITSLMVIR
jgi:hypothetical protein